MLGLILLFLTAYLLIVLIGSAGLVLRILRPPRKTYARALAQGHPLEPADVGLDAEPATFHLPDHATTPGWILAGKQPDGPTVLILHGHGDCRFGSLIRAYHLAPYAGRLVVFDWPGHGECTAKWTTCGVREPDDAIAVLDQLPDHVRDRPVVLFGYSLGAQIAIKTAGLHPERFAGVIADGPYRLWDSPIRKRMHHHAVPAFPFIQLAGLVFAALGMIQGFDRVAFAKRITAPLLILHGTDDRVCPIEEGRQLADAAPNATFIAIQDGRHNHLYDHDPDTYHAALRAFFEKL